MDFLEDIKIDFKVAVLHVVFHRVKQGVNLDNAICSFHSMNER